MAMSPLHWVVQRVERLSSNFVEAGAHFRPAPVGPEGDYRPDVRTHVIPYMRGYNGETITTGAGYFADEGVRCLVSRGLLLLASKEPNMELNIDLGILRDYSDVAVLIVGSKKLRLILKSAAIEYYAASEVFPSHSVTTDQEIKSYVRTCCATAHQTFGTLAIGAGKQRVAPDLRLKRLDGV